MRGEKNRPYLDPEASVTYYCTCLLTERKRLDPLFRSLRGTSQVRDIAPRSALIFLRKLFRSVLRKNKNLLASICFP